MFILKVKEGRARGADAFYERKEKMKKTKFTVLIAVLITVLTLAACEALSAEAESKEEQGYGITPCTEEETRAFIETDEAKEQAKFYGTKANVFEFSNGPELVEESKLEVLLWFEPKLYDELGENAVTGDGYVLCVPKEVGDRYLFKYFGAEGYDPAEYYGYSKKTNSYNIPTVYDSTDERSVISVDAVSVIGNAVEYRCVFCRDYGGETPVYQASRISAEALSDRGETYLRLVSVSDTTPSYKTAEEAGEAFDKGLTREKNGEIGVPKIAQPNENGRFERMEEEIWMLCMDEAYNNEVEKPDDSSVKPFFKDAFCTEKLNEEYPGITDWKTVYEYGSYEKGIAYNPEKMAFEYGYMPTYFVILKTEQGSGFDCVFIFVREAISADYEFDGEKNIYYATPNISAFMASAAANSDELDPEAMGKMELVSCGDGSNIPYSLWFPEKSAEIYFSYKNENKSDIFKIENLEEPLHIRYIRTAKYWVSTSGSRLKDIPKSRSNDCLIYAAKDETNEIWYYEAVSETARKLEEVKLGRIYSDAFVDGSHMEVFSDGKFHYYDFSDGADPTKCIGTLSGNGGGLLGGEIKQVFNNNSIKDKGDSGLLLIIYSENESHKFWICTHTIEEGVKENFCLDLSDEGFVGSCSVHGGMAYFSYYTTQNGEVKDRVNYAVDLRPDRDHTLQANAW